MELDTTNQQVTSSAQNNTPEPIVNSLVSYQKGFVPIIIGVVILLIVVAGGAYYLGTQKSKSLTNTQQTDIIPTQAKNNTQSTSPTNFPTTAPDVTANWKSYVNSNYDFSFKYPTDVFIYQGNAQQDAQFWSNKVNNGGAPLELGQDGVWLNMSFKTDNKSMMDFYNRIITMKPNETISQSADTKLSNIDSGGVIGATYYQGVPPNFVGEPAHTYVAVWIKNDMAYRLSLSAFTEQNLQKYREIFDQIVSSFQFTR